MALNILLVDDSRTVRSFISKALQLTKLSINEIYEAGNGQEALDLLNEQWIDLVFADINMPVMNGLEMVEQMAQHGLMESIPVVIVSTEGSETRVAQLKEKGIRGFIRKPFTPEDIKEVIDEVLGEIDGRE